MGDDDTLGFGTDGALCCIGFTAGAFQFGDCWWLTLVGMYVGGLCNTGTPSSKITLETGSELRHHSQRLLCSCDCVTRVLQIQVCVELKHLQVRLCPIYFAKNLETFD